MTAPAVLVLRSPGTNCDLETAFAFEQAGGRTERVHVNRLLEQPRLLDAFQILCFPGGFSYGDDLGAGRILANQIRHHLADTLFRFRDAGKLVLGICNGFQVLIKTGLLLAEHPGETPPATLAWNDSGRYQDRWVQLRVDGARSVFLAGIEGLFLPIAHAEGRFVPRDADTLQGLARAGQLPLRYDWLPGRERTTAPAVGQLPFPHNPNGAAADVAGVCDESGRVFGLMPHPERHLERTHHPQWTRIPRDAPTGDGLRLFSNAVSYFR